MMLAPNKNIMDDNQVIDYQLHVKVALMSFLLVLLISYVHIRVCRLINANFMHMSAPKAIDNVTTSSMHAYTEIPTSFAPSLPIPCAKSIS